MIPLVTFYSSLNLENTLASDIYLNKSIFSEIENIELFEPVSELTPDLKKEIALKGTSGIGILILTGGIESLAAELLEDTDAPVILLVNSKNNSLAAGLEIYGKYRDKNKINLISFEDYPNKVKNSFKLLNVFKKINSLRLLEIGKPSDWLLTSKDKHDFGKFKSELAYLDMEEINNFKSKIEPKELNDSVNTLNELFAGSRSQAEIEKSAKIYLSLRRMIEKEKANGISVKCFDLLNEEVTACLALSLLNDEGIVAGCEGDLQALITLVLVKELFGTTGWMANPSALNFEQNTFKLAHCTVPSNLLVEKGELDTHFESGKSLGVRGKMKKGKVTLIRIGGNFDKIQLAEGEVVENDHFVSDLCRTQVTIKLETDLGDWLNSALGNHQVMFYGHQAETVKEFARLTGLEIV